MDKKGKTRILVGICSGQSYAERRNAVRSTWLSHSAPGVECLFFLGGAVPEQERADTIGLDVPDTYGALPLKVLAFFRYALEHYDFDWLFKCDDDTYLDLSRLGDLPDDRYGIIGDLLLEERQAPSGGAGYMLSRRIVEKIVERKHIPLTGAEDLIFGKIALEVGAVPLATPRLFLAVNRYPAPHNDTVSSHWCDPETLHALEILRHSRALTAYCGVHPHWTDELLFFPGGVFRRRRSDCFGWWSLTPDGVLTLRWKLWAVEQLVWKEDSFSNGSLGLKKLDHLPSLWELLPLPSDSVAGEAPSHTEISSMELVHVSRESRFLQGWFNQTLLPGSEQISFLWKDGTVRFFFLEHIVESMAQQEWILFLKEIWRGLCPGGVMRVAIKDVARLVDASPMAYDQLLKLQFNVPRTPSWKLDALLLAEKWQSFWSRESLSACLRLYGFEVSFHTPGESSLSELSGLERTSPSPDQPFELLGIVCLEARKPDEPRPEWQGE
ncbi:hypothetical protein QET93_000980 [Akkermansia sp. N21116]|uniref:hypothetical protein n=1 Tax=Akkermansia sp. N21116 TaxID=3040764 RepID=UPI00244EAA28|nr:hypothetical protein [Akkermansia sp. N21116]WPX40675.1 hypothetical protein QET93_000980 [Akkermansia sp. N21116]